MAHFIFKRSTIAALIVLGCLLAKGIHDLQQHYPHLWLTQTPFTQLPAWEHDDHRQALLAFQRSCVEIQQRKPDANFSSLLQSGKVSTWQTICQAANQLTQPDAAGARQFFETWFTPYRVRNNFQSRGLFTGYYLPVLHGSLTPDKRFTIPIYAVPRDLVTIQLGAFRPDLAGKNVVGQLKERHLYPYPDRRAITQGAIQQQADVIAWTDNPLDLFFAQIQGSALVELPTRERLLINYAATNGQSYTAIGSILINKGEIPRAQLSMQTLRAWLEAHPNEMHDILNQNASYVFFKSSQTSEPLGSENIPLSPERSLAVDTHYLPLGAPIWLSTTLYDAHAFQHLLVAQDTGGAIKGIIRGDIYWGASPTAAEYAGQMQSKGQYWILLPKRTAS